MRWIPRISVCLLLLPTMVDAQWLNHPTPNIPRTGLFLPRSPLLEDIIQYGDTNANWWARGVWPDERGRPYIVHEGLARVTDVGTPSPADNLIQLNYTVRFSSLRTQFVPVP